MKRVLPLVERLHGAVDTLAAPIEAAHAGVLRCGRGCAGCCLDGLTVFAIEAARIEANYSELLQDGVPGPEGGCAFLDGEGACRIYDVRPYVCRTQGLPLRWLEDDPEGIVEVRDICPENAELPLEELPAEACFLLGPVEEKLRAIAALAPEGDVRVPLRSLFVAR